MADGLPAPHHREQVHTFTGRQCGTLVAIRVFVGQTKGSKHARKGARAKHEWHKRTKRMAQGRGHHGEQATDSKTLIAYSRKQTADSTEVTADSIGVPHVPN